MKNNTALSLPANYKEIQNLEAINGGGPFLNEAVDVLWEWIGKHIGKKTAKALSTTCGFAVEYFQFVDALRRTDPEGYKVYVYTYNRHQYCCHTMHAFDGKCAGPGW